MIVKGDIFLGLHRRRKAVAGGGKMQPRSSGDHRPAESASPSTGDPPQSGRPFHQSKGLILLNIALESELVVQSGSSFAFSM